MPKNTEAIIAIMGATGTGKSTFIRLLTNDENIRIGHDLESMTFDVATSHYIDRGARLRVTLVETPGFNDSREGVTDTDILEKIADFLQDKGGRKLNGVIYLHRISDPKFSDTAKKNLRVFRELCGDENLGHVRLVTTHWNAAGEEEKKRETALANGVFKPFIDAGAKFIRHDGGFESAKKIISNLARKTPVRMKIQDELNAGIALGDTSAGAVIVEEMNELQKEHAKELEEMKKDLEEAQNENNGDLRAELDKERRNLEERIARVEDNQMRLATMQTNLDERSQQATGHPSRVVYAKREKAQGKARERLQNDKGLGDEQRNSYRKGKQSNGENLTTTRDALAGGDCREQNKEDIPSPRHPPVRDISQVMCAKPEKAQEGLRKGEGLDGEQRNNHDEDKRSGVDILTTAQDATAGENCQERQQRKEKVAHDRSQDVNGEWVVYIIFMVSLVVVVVAVIQSK